MRRFYVSFLIIIFFSYLQTTLFSKLAWMFLGITPDISLIFLILFAQKFGQFHGIFLGFTSGLLEDFISIAPLGYYAFVKMIIGAIAGWFQGKIYLESLFLALVFVAIGTFLKYIFAGFTAFLTGIKVDATIVSYTFLFELFANVLLAIPIYYLFKFIIKKTAHLWQYEGDKASGKH